MRLRQSGRHASQRVNSTCRKIWHLRSPPSRLNPLTPARPSAFQVFVRCWRECTQHSTRTHTHTPLYKNAFLVRLFTDVYQHHTVCTAFSAAECQWQQTRLPLDCKCESSAFTPVTSRHLLLMWSAWMSVCVHKNSKAWTTVKFTLYCHCTTIKHGYR